MELSRGKFIAYVSACIRSQEDAQTGLNEVLRYLLEEHIGKQRSLFLKFVIKMPHHT